MEFIPLFPVLDEEVAEIIRNFLNQQWHWVTIAILIAIFYFYEVGRLIVGGFLLIFIGIKIYLLPAIKEKRSSYFLFAIPVIYMGIISLFTKFLLKLGVDIFTFIVILTFILSLLTYLILMPKLNNLLKILVFLLLTSLLFVLTISLNSALIYIYENGFSNFYFYLAVISFIFFLTLTYFTFFKTILEFVKEKFFDSPLLNNYFYFALSIMSITISSGYYYLSNISQNVLKDFLIILSVAFITSFVGVSAIKNLESKK